MSDEKQVKTVDGGCGPAFEVTDFPEPLKQLTPKKLFMILGPAIIALGGTIGGGEWLIGPSLFREMGPCAAVGHHRFGYTPGFSQSRNGSLYALYWGAGDRGFYET